MSAHNTKIEWTHFPGYSGETWNPLVGCSKVSAGCDHCYAERVSARFGLPWSEKPMFMEGRIDQPTRWHKRRAIFVCSMSDLFHPGVSNEVRDRIFTTIYEAGKIKHHIFLILTKRPSAMKAYINDLWMPLLDNVWLGVTVEDQEYMPRVKTLLETHCSNRFVSVEPMLGPVDLTPALTTAGRECNWNTLDWVICGGETGKEARKMDPAWARDLRDQCQAHSTPFFFKQMSKKAAIPEDLMVRQFPELPQNWGPVPGQPK